MPRVPLVNPAAVAGDFAFLLLRLVRRGRAISVPSLFPNWRFHPGL